MVRLLKRHIIQQSFPSFCPPVKLPARYISYPASAHIESADAGHGQDLGTKTLEYKVLLTVFITIFIAELGDKTQLATMLFAADKEVDKLTVFVGASLALIVASGIGVLAGSIVSQYASEKLLHYVAGIGFIGIGIWTLLKA